MQDGIERYHEAIKLLEIIEEYKDKLGEWEYGFCKSIYENTMKWGAATKISQKQLFKLRDIKDKVIL